jgi:predicted Zn-dependent protease
VPHFKTCEVLGELLLKAGQLQEATVFLAAAAGLGPRQSKPHFLLAKAILALDQSDVSGAREQLEEALRINPSYKAAHQLLADLNVEPLSDTGGPAA